MLITKIILWDCHKGIAEGLWLLGCYTVIGASSSESNGPWEWLAVEDEAVWFF